MMKTANRALSLILAAAAASLAGCGNTSDDVAPTTTDAETAEETTSDRIDSLPADLDFGGATVNILWWEENNEFSEELNGEVVNDALYERDINVESRLNVTLNNIPMSYTWDTRDIYIGTIRNSVMAGDGTYDIVSGQYYTMPSLIPDGILVDLAKLPYLDFTQPWWVNGLVEETSVDGKLFLATGEISINSIKELSCIFANGRLIDEYKLENPYELVDSGKWTLDKLGEMSSDIYTDINGNDTPDVGDLVGFQLYPNGLVPFIQSLDLKVTTNNDEGYPELTFGTEKVQDAIARLCSLTHDHLGVILVKDADEATQSVRQTFNDGLSVFMTGVFNDAAKHYQNMTDDFLVLPYPKYDEAQAGYYSALNEGNTLFGMTASCDKTDVAAAVMEAIASENHYTTSPAYFETALKIKYSRDDDSARMFDLIRENVVFGFGSIYKGIGIDFEIKPQIYNNDPNWASYYDSKAPSYKAIIDEFYEKVKALDA